MFWSNCSIIRRMSKYFSIQSNGVEIYARPSNFWRKKILFRNIPYLTGDFAPIDIFIKGEFNKPIKYTKILYEHNGFKYHESLKHAPNEHKYTFCGERLHDGLYNVRILMAEELPEVQERLWQSQPQIAEIHVMENWKPVVWLLSAIIGAILATIITLSIQKLLGII